MATSMMNKVMAIEGLSFAGKTTLTQGVENTLPNMKRIYELSEKYENGALFPTFPKNTNQANKSDIWFFEKERMRNGDVIECLQNSSVIMDRSYLSALTYSFSRQTTFNLGNYKQTKRLVITEGIQKNYLIEPYFIYLRMDYGTYLMRRTADIETRKRLLGERAVDNCLVPHDEEAFIRNQILFLETFYHENKSNILLLDCNSGVSYNISQIESWSIGLKEKHKNIYNYDF